MSKNIDKELRDDIFSGYDTKPDDDLYIEGILDYLSMKFYRCYTDHSNRLNIFGAMIFSGNIKLHTILTDEEFFKLFKHAWTCTDSAKSLGYQRDIEFWLSLKDNPLLMMNNDEQAIFNSLPDRITVYRGYRQGSRKGLAWTLDIKTAEFFAYTFGRLPPGRVVSIAIDKNDIYGIINDREEKEVLIPLAKQRNVKYRS